MYRVLSLSRYFIIFTFFTFFALTFIDSIAFITFVTFIRPATRSAYTRR